MKLINNIAILLLISHIISSQLYGMPQGDKINKKPELSYKRIGSQCCFGNYTGLLIAIGGFYIGDFLADHIDYIHQWDGQITGFTLGAIIGNTISIYAIGNIGNETGSFWATLGGSLMGSLPFIIYGCHDISYFFGINATCSIGSIIGFNLTRRYDKSTTALISIKEGQLAFGSPVLSLRPNPYDKNDIIKSMDIINMRF